MSSEKNYSKELFLRVPPGLPLKELSNNLNNAWCNAAMENHSIHGGVGRLLAASGGRKNRKSQVPGVMI